MHKRLTRRSVIKSDPILDRIQTNDLQNGPNKSLPSELLYAYIGVVWLILHQEEQALRALCINWGKGTYNTPKLSEAEQNTLQNNMVPQTPVTPSQSFWADPLGMKSHTGGKQHPALLSFISWKTRLMDGLITSNRLSAQERISIAELSEYGVTVESLTPMLLSTIRSAKITKSTIQGTSRIPNAKDTPYMILYNLIFNALKTVMQKSKQLKYDARLRNTMRSLASILMDAADKDPTIDEKDYSKMRSILQQEIENGTANQIWNELSLNSGSRSHRNSILPELPIKEKQTDSVKPELASPSTPRKTWSNAIANGIRTGAVVGLNSILAYTGVSDFIEAGLESDIKVLDGDSVAKTLFGAPKSPTRASSMIRSKDDFDMVLMFDKKPCLHIVFCVSGFILENEGIIEPWTILPAFCPFSRIEAVQFDISCLADVGRAVSSKLNDEDHKTINTTENWPINNPSKPENVSPLPLKNYELIESESVKQNVRFNIVGLPEDDDLEEFPSTNNLNTTSKEPEKEEKTQHNEQKPKLSLLSSITTAISWPRAFFSSKQRTAWDVGLLRAEKVGHILADEIILTRSRGQRPITLVGYSLGARVIFSALQTLAQYGETGNADVYSMIDSVYLIGSAIENNSSWTRVCTVVNGRFVNAYSKEDWMLPLLYQTSNSSHLSKNGIAGTSKINLPDSVVDSTNSVLNRANSVQRGPRKYLYEGVSTPMSPTNPNYYPPSEAVVETQADAKWIENVDISSIINNHDQYPNKLGEILEFIGFERTQALSESQDSASPAISASPTTTKAKHSDRPAPLLLGSALKKRPGMKKNASAENVLSPIADEVLFESTYDEAMSARDVDLPIDFSGKEDVPGWTGQINNMQRYMKNVDSQ